MRRVIKFAVAVMISIPMIANAAFISGNQLFQRINGDGYDKTFAIGFITGVHDAYEDDTICTGQHVTAGQLRDVVKKYLEDNPASRDIAAVVLVLVALGSAFPCNKKGKRL